MPKPLWMLTAPLILSSLYGCATRTIASQVQAKEAPQNPALQIPAPAPLLFQRCLEEARAKGPTSPPNLTPSCKALDDWRLSTLISSSANTN